MFLRSYKINTFYKQGTCTESRIVYLHHYNDNSVMFVDSRHMATGAVSDIQMYQTSQNPVRKEAFYVVSGINLILKILQIIILNWANTYN